MCKRETIQRLIPLFITLKTVLIAENETNWRRGIDLIIDALEQPLAGDVDADKTLHYVESTYKSMLGGNGSFSEFFIWRDDFDERVIESAKLESIKNEIWDILS